jgi:hypothetical protein
LACSESPSPKKKRTSSWPFALIIRIGAATMFDAILATATVARLLDRADLEINPDLERTAQGLYPNPRSVEGLLQDFTGRCGMHMWCLVEKAATIAQHNRRMGVTAQDIEGAVDTLCRCLRCHISALMR